MKKVKPICPVCSSRKLAGKNEGPIFCLCCGTSWANKSHLINHLKGSLHQMKSLIKKYEAVIKQVER